MSEVNLEELLVKLKELGEKVRVRYEIANKLHQDIIKVYDIIKYDIVKEVDIRRTYDNKISVLVPFRIFDNIDIYVDSTTQVTEIIERIKNAVLRNTINYVENAVRILNELVDFMERELAHYKNVIEQAEKMIESEEDP